MNINGNNVGTFLETSMQFYIPVYQRNYAWDTGDCAQLLHDLIAIEKSEYHHFFGSVCFIHENDQYTIIDGQQRIATTLLLLAAIRDCFATPKINSMINDRYLVKKKYTHEGDLKCEAKMVLNDIDQPIFEKILNISGSPDVIFDEEEQETDLYKNFMFFKDFINENIDDYLIVTEGLRKFDIATISIQKENPQLIFESLNFAGKKLTNGDLVRNYLLMPLPYDQQKTLYQNYWHPIEKMLGENMEKFLVFWLIVRNSSDSILIKGKRKKINEKTLYYAVKRDFPNINCTEESVFKCFEEMYAHAKYFAKIVNANSGPLYEFYYITEATNLSPLVMYILQNKEDVNEYMKYILSYIVRNRFVGSSSGLSLQFSGNCILRLRKKKNTEGDFSLSDLKYALTSGSGGFGFPDDTVFRTAFMTTNVYSHLKHKFINYILYSLERLHNPKEVPAFGQGTIEHIIPQKISEAWKESLLKTDKNLDALDYIGTMGNLALTGYNPEMSNLPFEDKKQIGYKDSSYHYTRRLAKFSRFGIQEMRKRASEMWADMLVLYPYIPFRGQSMGLGQDLRNFKFKKPVSFELLDGEKRIKNWSEMLTEVFRELYSIDEKIFQELIKENESWGIFNNPKKMTAQIGSIPVYTYMDTSRILNYIKQSLTFYDGKCGTTLLEDFRFKLRE